MFSRAMILLLILLNLGVACWWAFASDPMPAGSIPPTTTPRLKLASEVPARSLAMSAVPQTSAPAPPIPATLAPTTAAELQCWRAGPFTDAAALSRAQEWLQPRVARVAVVAAPAAGRGWRVWLPPLADRDSAQAMAQQIAAAGFNDFYVIPDGNTANSIALGRYGNEDTARRRQTALQAAGFDVQVEPLGASTQWLAITANAQFDASAAHTAIAATLRPVACAAAH